MTALVATGLAEAVPVQRYTRTAIILHWVIATLIGTNLAIGLLSGSTELPIEDAMMNLHKLVGMAVLALSLFRLGWRLAHRPPALVALSAWQMRLAGFVQALLYALMIAMPLTGWLVTSSFPGRHPISLGFTTLPFLPVPENLPRAIQAHDAHSTLAIVMAVLVAGHVAAALHHQFVRQDGLITRMLPLSASWRSVLKETGVIGHIDR